MERASQGEHQAAGQKRAESCRHIAKRCSVISSEGQWAQKYKGGSSEKRHPRNTTLPDAVAQHTSTLQQASARRNPKLTMQPAIRPIATREWLHQGEAHRHMLTLCIAVTVWKQLGCRMRVMFKAALLHYCQPSSWCCSHSICVNRGFPRMWHL